MVPHEQLIRFFINLTPRQREVVELVSLGLSNRDIAERLCISPRVVAEHLTNVYAQLLHLGTGDEPAQAGRYLLIRWFGGFFEQYPELSALAQQ